ncbi:MAG: magnesium transporter [Nitrososphaerota archaeon]
MSEVKKIVKESTVAELLSVSGGIVAGIILSSMTGVLEKVPGMLAAIPAFLNMRGAIFSSFGARISTRLHIGELEPKYRLRGLALEEALASFVLGISQSILIGILAYLVSLCMGASPSLLYLLGIFVVAGLLSNVIIINVTFFSDIWLYRHGIDPDNVIGPYITTIGDTIGLLTVIASVKVLGL